MLFRSTHKLCIKADDWFGYGKENTKNKWWWDFEDMEGHFEKRSKAKTGKPVKDLQDLMNKYD